ncbi:MAG: AfsR/SARP family transcriptional regulator [Candidatus Promineifilaceae bacterium]
MIQLYLVGKFRVRINNRPLTQFRSDKVRALLSYLTLENGSMFSRTQLASLLWSEYGHSSARTSLRAALSNLRKLLKPINGLFVVDGNLVRFNKQHPQFWCDVFQNPQLIHSSEFMLDLRKVSDPTFQKWLQAYKGGSFQQEDFLKTKIPSVSTPTRLISETVINLPKFERKLEESLMTHDFNLLAQLAKLLLVNYKQLVEKQADLTKVMGEKL